MWHACKQRAFALFGLQKCCPSRSSFGVSKKEQAPVKPRYQDPSRFAACSSFSQQTSVKNWENTCDGHSKNKYQHLHCAQWLETLSWVGTAFAIGLNYKLCSKARKCSRDDQSACIPIPLTCFCTATQSLLRLALLMPGQNFGAIKKNVLSLDSSAEQSLPLLQDSSGCHSNSSPHFSASNALLVDESVLLLEGATREYFAELENLAGLQLISTSKRAAFSHFLTASNLGSTKGHFNAGICYDTGQGTAVDYQKAAHHFMQASDAGHSYAAYNLGLYYLEGRKGVDTQPDVGLVFLRKASDLGIANAQYYLGLCYQEGWEVERNVDLAKDFFQKAALTGHKEAKNALADLSIDESREVKFSFDLPTEMQNEEELDLKHEVEPNLDRAPNSPTTIHLSASSPDLLESVDSKSVPERMSRTNEIDISRYLNVILPYRWIPKHSEEIIFDNGDINADRPIPVNSVVTICM